VSHAFSRSARSARACGSVERDDPRDLRAAYERAALDEAEVHEGIGEGRLVVDERLKRFFETYPNGLSQYDGVPDHALVEELRADARRAIIEYERHPLHLDAKTNRREAEKLEAKTRRLAGKLERRTNQLAATREKRMSVHQRAEKAKRPGRHEQSSEGGTRMSDAPVTTRCTSRRSRAG
jgi:hypothetical protein